MSSPRRRYPIPAQGSGPCHWNEPKFAFRETASVLAMAIAFGGSAAWFGCESGRVSALETHIAEMHTGMNEFDEVIRRCIFGRETR